LCIYISKLYTKSSLEILIKQALANFSVSAGKCLAAPAAPLPGHLNKISSQEIFLHLAGNF
jgi:hypothetical protein